MTDGACAPFLIHTDKSKTKEREKEERERERQQHGEQIDETTTAPHFTVGLANLHDICVETTNSGSMTQEVFYAYECHFVKSLPDDHGAQILFLDEHASCWSAPALLHFLIKNQVFLFFLPATLVFGPNKMMEV